MPDQSFAQDVWRVTASLAGASEVVIQRLDYGVGQGYWANTSEVPNDVTVSVDVYAVQE